MKLDAQGAIIVQTGVTEQGQGAEAVVAQCVASAFGVPIEMVRVITGDTDNTPYGGGTWASRAAGIGGEAAWQAGKALRANVLAVAGAMLQAKPEELDIRNGIVIDKIRAPSACRSMNWRASPIFVPIRYPLDFRPN